MSQWFMQDGYEEGYRDVSEINCLPTWAQAEQLYNNDSLWQKVERSSVLNFLRSFVR